jgi:hypothetical protein
MINSLEGFKCRLRARLSRGTSARLGIAVQPIPLDEDVTSQARGSHQQGSNRDEKSDHQPTHDTNANRLARGVAQLTLRTCISIDGRHFCDVVSDDGNWDTAGCQNTRRNDFPSSLQGFVQ